MFAVAKVFSTGNSQAVRLPKAFRVNATEMWITKDEVTGEITLKPKNDPSRAERIKELFRMIEEDPFTEDFIPERLDEPPRDIFADWTLDEQTPAERAPGRADANDRQP